MTSVFGPQGHKWQSRLFLSVLLGLEEEAKAFSGLKSCFRAKALVGGGGQDSHRISGIRQFPILEDVTKLLKLAN